MVKNNTHDHSKMEQKLYAKIDEIEAKKKEQSAWYIRNLKAYQQVSNETESWRKIARRHEEEA